MTENENYSGPFTMSGRRVVRCASCSTRSTPVLVAVDDIAAHEQVHSYGPGERVQALRELLHDATNAAIAADRKSEAALWESLVERLTDERRFESVHVAKLEDGDMIVNVGRVNAPPQRLGVFVVVETYATDWNVGTGKGETKSRNNIWHVSESVLVEREV